MALPIIAGAWTAVTSIGTYFTAKLASEVVGRVIIGAFAITSFTFGSAFVYFFFEAVGDVYNIINSLLDYIQTGAGGSSTVLQTFFGFLNCSGITAGINAVDGMVLSAVSFRLMMTLFKYFGQFVFFTYSLLKGVVR